MEKPKFPLKKHLVLDVSKSTFGHRFEMYVPVLDNDGELIAPSKFYNLTKELTENFGGCSIDYPYGGGGGIDGVWYSSEDEITHYDKNAIFIIWTKAHPESLEFFNERKSAWRSDFGQKILVITIQNIQVI